MKFYGVLAIAWLMTLAGCAQQKTAEQTAPPPPAPADLVVAGSVPAAPGVPAPDLGAPVPGPAAQLTPQPLCLQVEEAVFCTGIKDRNPQGAATRFDKSVKKIFFFTRVTKAKKPTSITHVWYWKEKKMAEVPLDVRSENWRTWSSKKIEPAWTGPWAVKVLDENGEVVTTQNFEVTP